MRCPLDEILRCRAAPQAGREGFYAQAAPGGLAPAPVLNWQEAVHRPGLYDMEVATSALSPEECCDRSGAMIGRGVPQPMAFQRIAGETGKGN